MKRPQMIEAIYNVADQWDFDVMEEDGIVIDWDNVKSYWVKWSILYIEYADGTVDEFEPNGMQVEEPGDCVKRPHTLNILKDDGEWDAIKASYVEE